VRTSVQTPVPLKKKKDRDREEYTEIPNLDYFSGQIHIAK
jgi:hypothetical protein